ncbi:MAG TPA: hypothetical protein DDY13_07275 [Cytophagales bacterium]|mgnify:CR=1 FL=1|jgi:hypothetical protein|nr:hypothetical protein [Cytophagales bacterium]
MDIIHEISTQLKYFKNKIFEDIQSGSITYSYNIWFDGVHFLDLGSLKKYLRLADIKDSFELKDIANDCKSIIDFWNNDICKETIKGSCLMPSKKLPDHQYKMITSKRDSHIDTSNDNFYSVHFLPHEVWGTTASNSFFDDNYEWIFLEKIVNRCSSIRSWIMASRHFIDIAPNKEKTTYKKLIENNKEFILRELETKGFEKFLDDNPRFNPPNKDIKSPVDSFRSTCKKVGITKKANR